MAEFCSQTHKRLVVASTALSLGVKFGDVRYAINWGPARDHVDQLLEAGRAGQDGYQISCYHCLPRPATVPVCAKN